jgi:hypothetical protein
MQTVTKQCAVFAAFVALCGCHVATVGDSIDAGSDMRVIISLDGPDVAAKEAPSAADVKAATTDLQPDGMRDTADSAAEVCPWGDQQVHQTSYGLATTMRICLVSSSASKLRYRVSTPSTPAGGGYVVVSFRKVSPNIEIDARIFPSQDSYPIDTFQNADFLGQDFDTWFAAAPAATFFIDVANYYGGYSISQDFEMSAIFVPLDDAYEPNDSRATAAPITVGTPISAYEFGGYTSAANHSSFVYDYYKVTLPAGIPTITLTGASPSFSFGVTFDDPKSQSFTYAAYGETGTAGSVSISPSGPVAAGDYYVFIDADYTYRDYGKGTTPPSYMTQMYTLVVTSGP